MLSAIRSSNLTRAEQVAARAAQAASRWQPLLMAGIGVLWIALGVLNGNSLDTLMWKSIAVAAVAWMTFEHWGFSNLLERRDAEIRRLQSISAASKPSH